MGNRRMASRRLPSFPLPFSCRSIFHRLHDTASTCNGIPHLSKALQRDLHNEELPNSQKVGSQNSGWRCLRLCLIALSTDLQLVDNCSGYHGKHTSRAQTHLCAMSRILIEAGRVFEADTYLKAMRGKRALPDAIRESGLVPGVLPIERVGLRNFQQDPSAAAAVHSRQVLHYSSNGLAVCLPASGCHL